MHGIKNDCPRGLFVGLNVEVNGLMLRVSGLHVCKVRLPLTLSQSHQRRHVVALRLVALRLSAFGESIAGLMYGAYPDQDGADDMTPGRIALWGSRAPC